MSFGTIFDNFDSEEDKTKLKKSSLRFIHMEKKLQLSSTFSLAK